MASLCSHHSPFARSECAARALQPLNVSPKLAQKLRIGAKLIVTELAPPIIHPPRGSLPVVLSVPHSGRDYPDWLVESATAGRPALASLEDPLVDRLVGGGAQRGVRGAISARAP